MASLTLKRDDLSTTRQYYLDTVDDLADALYTSSGLTLIHEMKAREAEAGGGPLLAREAELLGVDQSVVSASVLAKRRDWTDQLSLLEAHRIKTKEEIRSTSSPAVMYLLMNQFKELINVV